MASVSNVTVAASPRGCRRKIHCSTPNDLLDLATLFLNFTGYISNGTFGFYVRISSNFSGR